MSNSPERTSDFVLDRWFEILKGEPPRMIDAPLLCIRAPITPEVLVILRGRAPCRLDLLVSLLSCRQSELGLHRLPIYRAW